MEAIASRLEAIAISLHRFTLTQFTQLCYKPAEVVYQGVDKKFHPEEISSMKLGARKGLLCFARDGVHLASVFII